MAGLADLGVMGAAALAALLTMGAITLLRAIAHFLPNLSIAGVGLDLGGIFRSLAAPVIDRLVDLTKDEWAVVGWCWHLIAHVFSTIFGDVVDAISHVGDQIAHLFTVTIPGGVDHAITDAHHFATGAVHDATRALQHYTDLAIGALAGTVRGEIADAKTAIEGDLHDAKTALTHDIEVARKAVEGELHDLKVTIGQQVSSLSDTVASDFNTAKRYAESQAAAALSDAAALVNQARAEAENVAQADANRVQALLQKAIDATNATVGTLTGTVASDLTAAESYAHAQVAQGVATVTGELADTAGKLQTAISAASTAAAAGIAGAVQSAQADATDALNSADKALGDALAGVYGDLVGKAQAFTGDLTGIEGLLAGAITAAIAGVAARVATLEECSVGVCATSKNPFSNLLKDALGLTELAGVGVFLAQAINDPGAAIAQDAGILGGAISGGESLLGQLLAL